MRENKDMCEGKGEGDVVVKGEDIREGMARVCNKQTMEYNRDNKR